MQYRAKMRLFFLTRWQKIWSDPVWSKVISAIIIGIGLWIIKFDFRGFLAGIVLFFQQRIELSFLAIFIIGVLNIIFVMGIFYLAKNSIRPKYSSTAVTVDQMLVTLQKNQIDYCNIDKEVQGLETVDFVPQDQSNLVYFLANVYDGREAERIFIAKICKKFKIKIEGVYEIMGRWDILIKFRYSGKSHVRQIMDAYEKELEMNGVIYKNASMKTKDSDRVVYYDVVREINPFGKSIQKRYLFNTKKYLESRSLRGFMFIELHRDYRINYLDHLVEHLSKFEQLKDIIEYFSICRNDIIINFFMRCSQTSFIIILNNAIEEFLQKNDLFVVKHTCLCYTFNEPVLIS